MGQSDEETIAGNFKTTLIAAYGRKDFIMKKMKRNLIVITLVVALVSMLCTQVFAVYKENSCNIFADEIHMGYGTISCDTLDEYVMYGETQGLEADSEVSVALVVYYIHYDLATNKTESDGSIGYGNASTSVTVRPNLGTVTSGATAHLIDGGVGALTLYW